jgi:hypothetical protein
MAIQLGERVLVGLITTISGAIVDELKAIATETQSTELTAPTAYYQYQRAVAKDPSVYLEVWVDEVRNLNVPSTYTIVGNRHRCEVECTCRLTYINRTNANPDQSHIDGQRYAAALARIFLENPQLGDDPYIQFAQPLSYVPSSSRIDEAGLAHTVNQVTATLLVTIEEINT